MFRCAWPIVKNSERTSGGKTTLQPWISSLRSWLQAPFQTTPTKSVSFLLLHTQIQIHILYDSVILVYECHCLWNPFGTTELRTVWLRQTSSSSRNAGGVVQRPRFSSVVWTDSWPIIVYYIILTVSWIPVCKFQYIDIVRLCPTRIAPHCTKINVPSLSFTILFTSFKGLTTFLHDLNNAQWL